ncbi:retrovirus-related pol polyprotein from transposon TNT 1-94 [Tanacetum coccineum]
MSSIAKFDVEKFDGSNDFGLWRVKMRCLLIQHGWEAALDPFPGTMTDADKTAALKTNVYKKAHSALLLCLDNKVLREVNKEDYVAGKLSEHIDEFNKLIDDLANIDVDINDEDQALMLLTSLPSSYDNFVETLLYERESLTLEDVLSSLNSRELKKRTNAKDDGDGLYVRGMSDHRDNQGHGSSRSKSKGKGTYKLKCYICYFEDHLKKDYPKRNKKKSTSFVKKNVGQGFGMHYEGYDNGDLLMAVSEERFLEWIMDFGGSFHMMPRRDFLFDFKEFNGGTILLGDNRACTIRGTGKGFTVKLQNGRVKVKLVLVYNKKERLARVWHKRLGHISEACLHELEKREVLGNKGLGRKLKKLRTDNGLEFCNQEFNNLCKDKGISRHLTVSGTPQQNGLAERMNRTLLNKVFIYNIGEEDTYGFMVRTSDELLDVEDIWLDDVKPNIIISRDVVFNESLMYKDTLKGVGAADSGKEVEFEVELQGSRVEPTVDPHTGENLKNEDEEQDEGPQ